MDEVIKDHNADLEKLGQIIEDRDREIAFKDTQIADAKESAATNKGIADAARMAIARLTSQVNKTLTECSDLRTENEKLRAYITRSEQCCGEPKPFQLFEQMVAEVTTWKAAAVTNDKHAAEFQAEVERLRSQITDMEIQERADQTKADEEIVGLRARLAEVRKLADCAVEVRARNARRHWASSRLLTIVKVIDGGYDELPLDVSNQNYKVEHARLRAQLAAVENRIRAMYTEMGDPNMDPAMHGPRRSLIRQIVIDDIWKILGAAPPAAPAPRPECPPGQHVWGSVCVKCGLVGCDPAPAAPNVENAGNLPARRTQRADVRHSDGKAAAADDLCEKCAYGPFMLHNGHCSMGCHRDHRRFKAEGGELCECGHDLDSHDRGKVCHFCECTRFKAKGGEQ